MPNGRSIWSGSRNAKRGLPLNASAHRIAIERYLRLAAFAARDLEVKILTPIVATQNKRAGGEGFEQCRLIAPDGALRGAGSRRDRADNLVFDATDVGLAAQENAVTGQDGLHG